MKRYRVLTDASRIDLVFRKLSQIAGVKPQKPTGYLRECGVMYVFTDDISKLQLEDIWNAEPFE